MVAGEISYPKVQPISEYLNGVAALYSMDVGLSKNTQGLAKSSSTMWFLIVDPLKILENYHQLIETGHFPSKSWFISIFPLKINENRHPLWYENIPRSLCWWGPGSAWSKSPALYAARPKFSSPRMVMKSSAWFESRGGAVWCHMVPWYHDIMIPGPPGLISVELSIISPAYLGWNAWKWETGASLRESLVSAAWHKDFPSYIPTSSRVCIGGPVQLKPAQPGGRNRLRCCGWKSSDLSGSQYVLQSQPQHLRNTQNPGQYMCVP